MEEFMRHYEEVYPQMYRTALYYMRNQQEAEDAVQDAVLTAYEKFHQLRDKEKFAPWIMQILVNRCRRRMKTGRKIFKICLYPGNVNCRRRQILPWVLR